MERHYDVLGVTPEASRQEVRRAYRTLSKAHHPDRGGSRERFLRIKRAYEAITGERAPDDGETDGGSVTVGGVPDPTFDPTTRPGEDDGNRDRGLATSGALLTLELRGVCRDLSLASLLPDRFDPSVSRPVAFFEATNDSSHPLEWAGRSNTSFIGDDGFLYEGANVLAPHARELAPAVCASEARLTPGRAVRAVVVAAEMPADVSLEAVVYTQQGRTDDEPSTTERYLFELRPRTREALDRIPFDLGN